MDKHNSGGVMGIEKHTLAERDTEKLYKGLPTHPFRVLHYGVGKDSTDPGETIGYF